MSWRLRLYATGARLTVRPILARSQDPHKLARRLDFVVKMSGFYPRGTKRKSLDLAGVPATRFSIESQHTDRVILYFHGGAYLAGSAATHGPMLARLSRDSGIAVVAPDYRLATEAAFPAAYDDALCAWDSLIAQGFAPEKIVIGGDSAGGGLAFALLSTLCARATPPAGLFAMSPWCDLSLSGASLRSNADGDAILPASRITEAAHFYLDGADARDARASPLFADFPNPPPVLIHLGSPEILSDDSARMVAHLTASGADATLKTWSGAPHVWHLAHTVLPEARDALRDIARFVQTSFDKANRKLTASAT